MQHNGWEVEDGADAGLQSGRPAPVDHHHLVDLLGILMGQESAERNPVGTGKTQLFTILLLFTFFNT